MFITKHDIILAAMAATTTMALACSSAPKEASVDSMSKTSQAAAQVGATHYTMVEFQKGQHALSEAERSRLQELVAAASKHGKVSEFQVLAWADKEYPAESQKPTSRDEKLADRRADAIKEFLKKDANTNADVEAHNMAKRPGFFAELAKTEDFNTKNQFENAGAAPNDVGPRATMMGNKASKALVLVKYE